MEPEGRGGEKRAFHAMGHAAAQGHAGRVAGRAAGLDVVTDGIVEEALHEVRSAQRAEGGDFVRRETVLWHPFRIG